MNDPILGERKSVTFEGANGMIVQEMVLFWIAQHHKSCSIKRSYASIVGLDAVVMTLEYCHKQ